MFREVKSNIKSVANNNFEMGNSIKFMVNFMDYDYNLERINNQGELVGDMAQLYYSEDSHINYYELA